MVGSFLKTTLFAAAILIAGQIPVGKETVGEVFFREVRNVWNWGYHKVISGPVFSSLGRRASLSSGEPQPVPPASENDENTPEEEISSSDRESLLRMLE